MVILSFFNTIKNLLLTCTPLLWFYLRWHSTVHCQSCSLVLILRKSHKLRLSGSTAGHLYHFRRDSTTFILNWIPIKSCWWGISRVWNYDLFSRNARCKSLLILIKRHLLVLLRINGQRVSRVGKYSRCISLCRRRFRITTVLVYWQLFYLNTFKSLVFCKHLIIVFQ